MVAIKDRETQALKAAVKRMRAARAMSIMPAAFMAEEARHYIVGCRLGHCLPLRARLDQTSACAASLIFPAKNDRFHAIRASTTAQPNGGRLNASTTITKFRRGNTMALPKKTSN